MEKRNLRKVLVFVGCMLTVVSFSLTAVSVQAATTSSWEAKLAAASSPPSQEKPGSDAKPSKQIMIAGGRVGDSHNVLSEALAYFINKKSKWLKATVFSTPGLGANDELARDNPQKYISVTADWLIRVLDNTAGYKFYDKMRSLSPASSGTIVWVTYDKDKKNLTDFVGKAVNIGREGSALLPGQLPLLEAIGLKDKVKLVRSSYGESVTNMKDGLVQVTQIQVDHVYPGTFKKGAFITDMESRAPIHYVNVDLKVQEELFKKGKTFVPIRIPAGALDPKTQTTDIWGASFVPMFGADLRMDPDVVYEVTRVLYESAGEFASWHVQGQHLTKEFIPTYVFSPDFVHPEALRYYKDNNISVKDLAQLLR